VINWVARARAYLAQPAWTGTPTAPETLVTGVMGVTCGHGSSSNDVDVTGVMGVGEESPVGNEQESDSTMLDELLAAATRACDFHNDSEAARAEMRLQCLKIPPHLRADLVQHFIQVYGSVEAHSFQYSANDSAQPGHHQTNARHETSHLQIYLSM
jgi:hypothetical protein